MNMNRSAVNLGSGGFNDVYYMQDGGNPFNLNQVLEDTGPGATSPQPEYVPLEQAYTQEMEDEKGIGSIIYDRLFGKGDITDGVRESGRVGGDDAEFMSTLIEKYNYPSVFDPETGQQIIPTDTDVPEAIRMARPVGRRDMPTYPELEDARAHALSSALLSKEYGPKTAEKAGNFGEFVDRFAPFPFGGQNPRDVAMDQRNNAAGRQIFLKAGYTASAEELAETVNQEIFNQLEVILGRTPEEQFTPAPDQPRAPRNFKSPEEGPMDVYFPRNEKGFFDTTRKVLGFSPRRYRNY